MKKYPLLFLLLLLGLPLVKAYDFDDYAPTGQRLCFQIISAENHTCGIVRNDGDLPAGELVVPQQVMFQEEAYRVVELLSVMDACTGYHGAFESCEGLTHVTLPNSIIAIGGHAFGECAALVSVALPDSLVTLGPETFAGCISLAQINLPSTLTYIPQGMFRGCVSLERVELPAGIQTLEGYAFYDCERLSQITLNESLETIDEEVFSGCRALTMIDLPATLGYVGEYVFHHCDGLLEIISRNEVPPLVADVCAFYGVRESIPLRVPAIAMSAYAEAYGWNRFSNITSIEGNCVQDVDGEANEILVKEGKIKIVGAKSRVIIADVMGRVLFNDYCVSDSSFVVPQRGIYLVTIGSAPASKVMVF